ncbi:hypothetical protein ACQZ4Y_20475 [Rhizobium sp. L80/93]|uniref:hypothetical protein n=1 Tax=unclassified Rhizobium TaxID=2613769 RepID=UPI001ADCA993|nr:hypothetical protein [Rhizobium sp. B21/90]MBO9186869.1 hypothetical protein [Rhizobium sp. E27B/91]QYA03839.1 hypothetical protein J5278_23935 [Rhizobium sp. B21/90]
MDAAYVSAFFGLAGALVGSVTSFTTSWITLSSQVKEKRREANRTRREALFEGFLSEAARLYGDALSHEKDDIGDIVMIYAILARMHLVASKAVTDAGERVMDAIVGEYMTPNRSLSELRLLARSGHMNVLEEFAAACRNELDAF